MGDSPYLRQRRRMAGDAYTDALKRLEENHPDEMQELQKENPGTRSVRLAQRILRDKYLHEFKTIYAEEAIKLGIRPRSNRDSVYWRIARLRMEGEKGAVE